MRLPELRGQVVAVGIAATERGVVHGTAGNMSIRDWDSGLIAISPSGIPFPDCTAEDVVIVDDQGTVIEGHRRPSSETALHTMVHRERPRIRAILHTHSHYSTVVGCIRPFLPPVLTEVCQVIGARVPVTRYGISATPDFGHSVLEVLDDGIMAVILKNHGLICFGDDFDQALGIAEIVEEAAKVYIHALAANSGREPDLVPEEVISELHERFLASYGQPARSD